MGQILVNWPHSMETNAEMQQFQLVPAEDLTLHGKIQRHLQFCGVE